MTAFGHSRLKGDHEDLAFEWLKTAINEKIYYNFNSIMKIQINII